MNFLGSLFLVVALLFTGAANASVIGGKEFSKTIFIDSAVDTSTESAANDGRDYASAKGFFDGDLMDIPANVVITNVYVVVDTAISGLTAFNIGDDDTASGFIASSAPATSLASTGLLYWNVDYKGSYLKGGIIVTSGLLAKYYSATGKEVKLDVTGTASAGKMRVFVHGYAVGPSS